VRRGVAHAKTRRDKAATKNKNLSRQDAKTPRPQRTESESAEESRRYAVGRGSVSQIFTYAQTAREDEVWRSQF
jgi:hypothetical protein